MKKFAKQKGFDKRNIVISSRCIVTHKLNTSYQYFLTVRPEEAHSAVPKDEWQKQLTVYNNTTTSQNHLLVLYLFARHLRYYFLNHQFRQA